VRLIFVKLPSAKAFVHVIFGQRVLMREALDLPVPPCEKNVLPVAPFGRNSHTAQIITS